MNAYTKPHLSLEEQLELLEARGLKISDRDRARSALARIGYFRLSAYWRPFYRSQIVQEEGGRLRSQPTQQFRTDADFATALDLYIFDKRLRLLFLDALERIEVGTAATARKIASVVPKAELTILADGGHIWLGHDDEVAERIHRFLALSL